MLDSNRKVIILSLSGPQFLCLMGLSKSVGNWIFDVKGCIKTAVSCKKTLVAQMAAFELAVHNVELEKVA